MTTDSTSAERRGAWERRYREGKTAWDRGGTSPALMHWLAEGRLAQWLRPGGTLLALFMRTGREGGPPFDRPMPDMVQPAPIAGAASARPLRAGPGLTRRPADAPGVGL